MAKSASEKSGAAEYGFKTPLGLSAGACFHFGRVRLSADWEWTDYRRASFVAFRAEDELLMSSINDQIAGNGLYGCDSLSPSHTLRFGAEYSIGALMALRCGYYRKIEESNAYNGSYSRQGVSTGVGIHAGPAFSADIAACLHFPTTDSVRLYEDYTDRSATSPKPVSGPVIDTRYISANIVLSLAWSF